MTTLRQRYASHLLRKPVRDYITELRDQGVSWPKIARAIENDTNGEIVVTPETVRAWAR
jgi:hypothetical protein